RLARETATLDGDPDVHLARVVGQLERLAEHHARGLAAEVVLQAALVDLDLAGAGREPDAGDGFLAAARGVLAVLDHVQSSTAITRPAAWAAGRRADGSGRRTLSASCRCDGRADPSAASPRPRATPAPSDDGP